MDRKILSLGLFALLLIALLPQTSAEDVRRLCLKTGDRAKSEFLVDMDGEGTEFTSEMWGIGKNNEGPGISKFTTDNSDGYSSATDCQYYCDAAGNSNIRYVFETGTLASNYCACMEKKSGGNVLYDGQHEIKSTPFDWYTYQSNGKCAKGGWMNYQITFTKYDFQTKGTEDITLSLGNSGGQNTISGINVNTYTSANCRGISFHKDADNEDIRFQSALHPCTVTTSCEDEDTIKETLVCETKELSGLYCSLAGNGIDRTTDCEAGKVCDEGVCVDAPEEVDGACGTAHQRTYAYTGTTNTFTGDELCSDGSPSSGSVTLDASKASSVSWQCRGQDGGTNAECSASRCDDTCTEGSEECRTSGCSSSEACIYACRDTDQDGCMDSYAFESDCPKREDLVCNENDILSKESYVATCNGDACAQSLDSTENEDCKDPTTECSYSDWVCSDDSNRKREGSKETGYCNADAIPDACDTRTEDCLEEEPCPEGTSCTNGLCLGECSSTFSVYSVGACNSQGLRTVDTSQIVLTGDCGRDFSTSWSGTCATNPGKGDIFKITTSTVSSDGCGDQPCTDQDRSCETLSSVNEIPCPACGATCGQCDPGTASSSSCDGDYGTWSCSFGGDTIYCSNYAQPACGSTCGECDPGTAGSLSCDGDYGTWYCDYQPCNNDAPDDPDPTCSNSYPACDVEDCGTNQHCASSGGLCSCYFDASCGTNCGSCTLGTAFDLNCDNPNLLTWKCWSGDDVESCTQTPSCTPTYAGSFNGQTLPDTSVKQFDVKFTDDSSLCTSNSVEWTFSLESSSRNCETANFELTGGPSQDFNLNEQKEIGELLLEANEETCTAIVEAEGPDGNSVTGTYSVHSRELCPECMVPEIPAILHPINIYPDDEDSAKEELALAVTFVEELSSICQTQCSTAAENLLAKARAHKTAAEFYRTSCSGSGPNCRLMNYYANMARSFAGDGLSL